SALAGRGRPGLSALVGFLVSVLYEALQYLLAVGSADVTDVILNTLGALAGAGAYFLLKAIFKGRTDRVIALAGLIIGLISAAFIVFLFVMNR
ncbi:MAG: VanZ family protein, partial [Clostridia bacterium]|nr:VanZ family protein [Clostridia bacterium]